MRNERPASLPYVRCIAWIVVLGVFVTATVPATASAQERRVVVVPGLEAGDLAALTDRGAVGLLVPDAGPRTSGARARAALERGAVRNSVLGGLPKGEARLDVETAGTVPSGPAIVLGLPTGGEQPNHRRYPIAVLGEGYRGVLTSDSTRIPGLVSIVDVAPTALGEDGALRSSADDDPLGTLEGPRRAHRGEPGRKDGRAAPVPGTDRRRRDLLSRRCPSDVRRRAAGEPRARRDRLDRGLDRRAGPGLHRRRRPASGARGTGRPWIPHGRRARRLPGGNGGRRALGRPLAARPDAELALLWTLEPAGDPAPGPVAGRRRPALAPLRALGVRGRGGAFARHGRRKLVRSGRGRRNRPPSRLPRPRARSSSASTGDWRSAAPRSPSCWPWHSPWAARAT